MQAVSAVSSDHLRLISIGAASGTAAAEYHTTSAMHAPLSSSCHSDLPYEPAGYYGHMDSDLARLQQNGYLKDSQRLLSFTSYAGSTLGLNSKFQQPSTAVASSIVAPNPYLRPGEHHSITEEAQLRLDLSDSALQMPVHLQPYGTVRQGFGPQLPLEPFQTRLPQSGFPGDAYNPSAAAAGHQFFFISRPSPQEAFPGEHNLKPAWIDRLHGDFPSPNAALPKMESQMTLLSSFQATTEDCLKVPKREPPSAVAASDTTSNGRELAPQTNSTTTTKFKSNGQAARTPKFQCNVCGKQYCRRSTLKAHLRQHSGERPYLCNDCGKRFSQAANLTAHRRVHTGEKPFSCSICCRPFSQSSSLVTHKRTHTGERPYQCTDCDKAFTDSSTLTKHMRIHTGLKPYQCHICMLRFSQSGNLNRHMKTHSKQASWPECC